MEACNEARRAKQKVKALLAGVAGVRGVGITMVRGAYAVKVNLQREPDDPAVLPREVDGVPVVYDVVGDMSAHDRGGQNDGA